MRKKIIISITLLLLIFSTMVFATDTESRIIDSDIYTSEKDKSILDNEVSGNVFNISTDFELSSSAVVNGDLFLVAKNVLLKSDVTYSDTLSKDNEPAIDKINSSVSVSGNVYIVCNEFTMEPGVEINGDLYIVARKIDMQKSSVVRGNIFATAKEFILNGRVEHSVYASANSFLTNYYSTIYRDLYLTSSIANLNSVIRRNISIDSESVITNSDFLVYGDLVVNANNFKYSGEIDGNAKIASKDLSFVDTSDEKAIKCIIKGDLNYSSTKEIENIDTYVNGAVAHATYKNQIKDIKSKFNVKTFILDLLTFTTYIFIIAWIFTLLNKKHINNILNIKTGNTFASLGIGLLTFLIVIVLSILLFIINIGITLSFAIIFAYIFLLFISTPLFVLDIAITLKGKCNIYLRVLLITIVLFLICQIPYIGGLIGFLFTTIGCGRITLYIFHNAKDN